MKISVKNKHFSFERTLKQSKLVYFLYLFVVSQSNVGNNEVNQVIDQDLVWAQLLSCRNAGYVFLHNYKSVKFLTFIASYTERLHILTCLKASCKRIDCVCVCGNFTFVKNRLILLKIIK